jgi:hypothetical protein
MHINMIIDGRSCDNVVRTTFVRKLRLNTTKHHKPHRLQWLNEYGELKVNKHILISFLIWRYSGKVFYYAVLTHASHLLLERS